MQERSTDERISDLLWSLWNLSSCISKEMIYSGDLEIYDAFKHVKDCISETNNIYRKRIEEKRNASNDE